MPQFVDQLGRNVEVNSYPSRIISLVPSQTELLHDLGLNEEVAGITKFCIHPKEWFRSKARIGGTKQLNTDKIIALQPDLIIANKEENVQQQIEVLAQRFPVWVSDVNNLEDALVMINEVGKMVHRKGASQQIIETIKSNFHNLEHHTPNSKPRACYLIWKEPYMSAGGDTFISNMLQLAGFENIFQNEKRYPEVTIEALQKRNCEILLLSSEPFPFQQKHIDELQPLLPETKMMLVDGEYFSWYGSRLQSAPKYFHQLQQQITSNA